MKKQYETNNFPCPPTSFFIKVNDKIETLKYSTKTQIKKQVSQKIIH
jgi:hypothetical protein